MSAESELEALINQATAAATSLSGSATALVSAAIGELGADNIQFLDEFGGSYAEQGVDTDGAKWPAPFPVTPAAPPADELDSLQLQHPKRPSLRRPNTIKMDAITELADVTFPTLSLPSFQYPAIAALGTFDADDPAVDESAITLPSRPLLDTLLPPEWLVLGELPNVAVTVTAPTLATLPDGTVFTFDGPAELAKALGRIMAELDPLLAAGQGAADADILAYFDPATTLEDWPGTETLDARLATLRAAIETTLEALVTGSRSGWTLPGPVQQALRRSAAQWLSVMEQWANSLLTARKVELREDYLRLMTGILADLQTALMALRDRHAEQVLAMHQAAIRYATRVTQALLRAFETQEFGAYDRQLDAALARLALVETELKIAITQFEILEANQAIADADQDMDALRLEQAREESEAQATLIKEFATQVAIAKTEVELQKQPWQVFVLKVRLLAARVGLQEALYRVAAAQGENDEALLEGASASLKAFREQIQAFEQELSLLEAADASVATSNESVLETYRAEIKAELGTAEMDLSDAKMDLSAYQARAKVYLTRLEQALEEAKASASFEDRRTEYETRVQEANRNLVLELADTEMEHDRAVADVTGRAAALLANMAEAAISTINGLAQVAVEEG